MTLTPLLHPTSATGAGFVGERHQTDDTVSHRCFHLPALGHIIFTSNAQYADPLPLRAMSVVRRGLAALCTAAADACGPPSLTRSTSYVFRSSSFVRRPLCSLCGSEHLSLSSIHPLCKLARRTRHGVCCVQAVLLCGSSARACGLTAAGDNIHEDEFSQSIFVRKTIWRG